MPPCSLLRLFLPLTSVLLAASGPLSAADFTNTSQNGDWFDSDNWRYNIVPIDGSSVTIINGETAILRANIEKPTSLSLSWLVLGEDPPSPDSSGGTLEIDGAITLVTNYGIDIGNQADSTLHVTGGASLKTLRVLNIGGATTGANGRGIVKIDGTGTRAEVDSQLNFASGTLDISGGATFVVTNAVEQTYQVNIGHTENAEAILTLDGATWESTGAIRIGSDNGSGEFILKGNAQATFNGIANATATDGPTAITIGQDGGTGKLAVTSGSTLASTGVVQLGLVKDKPGTKPSGSVIVSGTGSQWTHHGGIQLDFGSSLTVSGGGILQQDISELRAKSESGITVTGSGSLLHVSSLTLESTSTLLASQGGRVKTEGTFLIRDNVDITLDQGVVETVGLSFYGGRFTIGNGSSLKTEQTSAIINGILTVDGPGFDAGSGSGPAPGFEATNRILIGSTQVEKLADVLFSGGAHIVTADGGYHFTPVTGPGSIKLIDSWGEASFIGASKTQNYLAKVVIDGKDTRWEHSGSLYIRGQTDIAIKSGATLAVSDGIYIGAENGLDDNWTWTETATHHTLLLERDATLKAAWILFGSGNADVTLQGTLETGSLFRTRTEALQDVGGSVLGERNIHFDGATFKITANGWRMGDGSATGSTGIHRNDVLAGVFSNFTWNNGFRPGELILDAGGLVVDTSEMGDNEEDVIISATFTGEGGLVKTGSGTLRLANANLLYEEHHTFTGGIEVREGTLALSDPVMDPATIITLAQGTTLVLDFEGTLTIAALIVDGITLTPGTWNQNNLGAYLTGTGTFFVSAVPEPATWTTLAIMASLLAACILRHRRCPSSSDIHAP